MESRSASHPAPQSMPACANCGSELAGDYCHRCGQSVVALSRSFLTLAHDTLDGLFDWDGRLLRTLRGMFARPGGVARDYIDGRRASYTPPMRLYVLMSVIFFAAMSVANLRVVAIDNSLNEDGRVTTVMSMWQAGATHAPVVLTEEQRERYLAAVPEEALFGTAQRLAQAALDDPSSLEQAANASASQAQILMVAIFTLMMMLLHPKRRIIEHIVYALYFHATALPVAGVMLIISAKVDMNVPWLIAWGITAFLITSALITASDRGFYGGSRWAAILRTQLIIPLYIAAAALVTVGLLILSLPQA